MEGRYVEVICNVLNGPSSLTVRLRVSESQLSMIFSKQRSKCVLLDAVKVAKGRIR